MISSNVKELELPIISVSQYLDILNEGLETFTGKILGEICNLKLYPDRSYMYFSVKDKNDQSIINCFMWKRDYNLSGVAIEEGTEVILTGYPKIYKPNGGITFQTEYIESVGEGTLKKAYDELKQKLEAAGLFSEERKRKLPDYPCKIGIITSKDGAVINDFLTNIGKYGYELQFINTRVEGKTALKELISAVKTFRKKELDILVIMRGGGSLESFQAFNNETLLNELANFPAPVITGLGHDKDLPLCALVSDLNVSTPTKAAVAINQSWDHATQKVSSMQNEIILRFTNISQTANANISEYFSFITAKFNSIFYNFEKAISQLQNATKIIDYKLKSDREALNTFWNQICTSAINNINTLNTKINNLEKTVQLNDPMRQLKLGYSLIMKDKRLIKSVNEVNSGDIINIRLFDGQIKSEVK